jgi:hypothetical protein
LAGLLRGAISFRFEGDAWTPDDFRVAAIGMGGNSDGFAELRIAGDDPEAIAKLIAVRWQDYSQFFRRVYLDRFELATKTVLVFSPDKKGPPVGEDARRGRKPKYDWREFQHEVVRVNEENPSWNQASREKSMLGWCIDNWGEGKIPSESLIREHVKLALEEAEK